MVAPRPRSAERTKLKRACFMRGLGEAVRFRDPVVKSPPTRPYCISCNRLIIKDLIWISPLPSPHYIPLIELLNLALTVAGLRA